MLDLREVEARLGLSFDDYSLLERALTHRSFLNENPRLAYADNERLEFLGDAVLDFVVGSFLFHRFPEMNEGELTMLRAALVRTDTLAGFASRLGLGDGLRLGHGEEESGGRQRPPILCATFEAIVGAFYMDQGMADLEPWVHALIEPELDRIIDEAAHRDAKSEFQIWAQATFNVTPHYRVINSEGPDHDKSFTVAVLLNEKEWGVGTGRSKQSAAQAAASAALVKVEGLEIEEALDNTAPLQESV